MPGPKDNAFARAHGLADRFVADALGQRRPVAEPRRPASRPPSGCARRSGLDRRDRRRRRRSAARSRRWPSAAGSTNVRFLPYQPKALLRRLVRGGRRVRRVAQGRASKATSCRARSTASSPPDGLHRRDRPEQRAGQHRPRAAAAGWSPPPATPTRWPRPLRRCTTIRRRPARWVRAARHAAWHTIGRVAVQVVSRLFAARGRRGAGSHDQTRVRLRRWPASACCVSAPLWALIALAIKLEDGGPVFFRQARVGLGGRVFNALKFRSMVPGRRSATGPVQATENDPRVTRIGRVLRGDGDGRTAAARGTSSPAT